VLVDGVRLNDTQSGHHNGDIPVPLEAVERIEVLHGPGSSLFGADAFGGTINIITRRERSAGFAVQAGSFEQIAARAQAGVERGRLRQVFAASVDRSAGFMIERGYVTTAASSRTSIGDRTNLLISHVWKDFGAFNFYGGNVPSHEWTNQALVALDRTVGTWAGWRVGSAVSYRTHGDRFLFDVRRPGVAENRHRTHNVIGSIRASHPTGDRGSFTVGVEGGGDWMRSTNLGDHTLGRVSTFGEWRLAVGRTAQIDMSARMDRYNEFGTAVNPSLGVGYWPAGPVRLRASAGRAFRVPTFTERYYQDPANWARAETGPETAWALEGGADLFVADGWTASATLFGRTDHDVIDWLRPTTADRWRTYNIRDVDTLGAELTARHSRSDGSFVQFGYTALDVRAAAVTQMSKYVLDYAPHTVAASASAPVVAGVRVAPRIEYKRRTRSTGTSDYAVFDVRVSRRVGMYDLRVEGSNLANVSYQEVLGVAMPGRAFSVAVAFGPS
jgi:iron complex outermembrane receptor protein